jgi:hypothetical protein
MESTLQGHKIGVSTSNILRPKYLQIKRSNLEIPKPEDMQTKIFDSKMIRLEDIWLERSNSKGKNENL